MKERSVLFQAQKIIQKPISTIDITKESALYKRKTDRNDLSKEQGANFRIATKQIENFYWLQSTKQNYIRTCLESRKTDTTNNHEFTFLEGEILFQLYG